MIVHFTLLELAILELAKNPKFQSILQRKMKEFNLKAPYERYNLDCVYVSIVWDFFHGIKSSLRFTCTCT